MGLVAKSVGILVKVKVSLPSTNLISEIVKVEAPLLVIVAISVAWDVSPATFIPPRLLLFAKLS